ncbi:TRAP transporter permease [Dysosmobacter sp.]|uniref:TRAP transporter permease n=1 Tax=Dysosmobacter sp. TaxID=2591382 RepID=UPI002A850D9A|nr:TRAP transporter permease [Dysosmobacter sp.]MDY3985810.1 TRAP transporter permease [Dysosmobacter sp.]
MSLFKKKPQTQPEEVDLTAIDRESKYKIFSEKGEKLLTVVLTIFALFQLYASISNKVPLQILRYTHLGFAICLAFLIYPATKHADRKKLPWYDCVLSGLFFCVVAYFIINYKALQFRAGAYTTMDVVMAGLGVLLVLTACWRVVGPPIVIIASCFFVYGLIGNYLPSFLHHRGFSLQRVITHLFITTNGIIGNPLGVCSTYIFLFILFGAFLEKTGIGQFFIDLANSLAGWAAGGPAKVAVLSSALQGTVSGSSVSNTVSTGSFTIPLMKSLGYTPEFAGAVEAAASTGGQIMPPVMGSAAFLISEACGVPYRELMLIAIIPASLYFIGIWISVHLEAKRLGLKGTPRDQLPKLWPLIRDKGHLLLPLIAIIYLMLDGYTITRAALIGCLVCIIVPYLRKGTRVPFLQIFKALPQAGRSVISVATACSTAGIIIGMVTLTGLGQRIGAGIFDLVGNNVFLALVCAMFTSLILGMGVSTTSNYLITSTIAAPILIKAGIPMLASHMFCFYFGIVADITPPVALAAYAGSAIAKGNAFKTGVNATKLAIAAFLIPYMFAMNPKMIMIGGTFLEALPMICTAVIGLVGIGAGFIGYLNGPVPSLMRLVSLAGGLLLVIPGTLTDVIGIALVALVYVTNRLSHKKRTAAVTADKE